MELKELRNKGTVYKACDGYWRGVVRYKDESGTLRRKGFCATTKKAVLKKIKNYIAEFKKEIEESDESKKPLKNSMQNWLEVFKYPSIARATRDSDEQTEKTYIYPQLENIRICDITAADLNGVLVQMMNNGYSHSTVKKIYCLLNQYFRFLYTEENPMANVKMIRKSIFNTAQGKDDLPPTDLITVLTDDDITRLKEEVFATRENGKPKHQQAAAYLFMLNTGIRAGEALGLLNMDIDLEKGLMRINQSVKEVNRLYADSSASSKELIVGQPKTKTRRRTVPLNRTAVEMIDCLRAERYFGENTPLIPDKNGSYTKPSVFRSRWNNLLKEAEIEQKGLHTLRHTFATILVNGKKDENGNFRTLPLRQVANILDHATTTITEKYYVKRNLKNLIGITDNFKI